MGQPLLNILYSIIPITIMLYIIPFKDILVRGMVASGAAPAKRFILYYSYYNNIIFYSF